MQLRVQGRCRTQRSCVLRAINAWRVQTRNVACGRCGQSVARAERATRPSTIQRIANAPPANADRRRAAVVPQDVASEVAALDAALSAYSTRVKAAIIKGMPRAWRTGDEHAYVLRVDVSSMQVWAVRWSGDCGPARHCHRAAVRSEAAPLRATRDGRRKRRCAAPWIQAGRSSAHCRAQRCTASGCAARRTAVVYTVPVLTSSHYECARVMPRGPRRI